MTRLIILVEGQTEQRVADELLSPHLAELGISARCTRLCTSREEGRREHRGGCGSFGKIRNDVRNLLLDGKPDALTTMFDLYGFPKDVPGLPDPLPVDGEAKAVAIESALALAIGNPRFIPNLLVHEFEGLLFSSPEAIAEVVPAGEGLLPKLAQIAATFPSPEHINDSPATAPSKRLTGLVPRYRKTLHGPGIARRIGLTVLRAKCPHFAAWVTRLESLAPRAPATS